MRVLHVNDVARIGSALVAEATRQGLDWSLYDTARVDPSWSPGTRALRRALRGAAWEAGLLRRAVRADLLSIHGATVTAHTRWLRRPYTLHLHGTDIRERRYEERWAALVTSAVRKAQDVYYTTPDLAEHVLDLRADATLQPVIVDVSEMPEATAATTGRPRILFPSRWDPAKGGERQLELLRALRARLGDDVVLEGLDWGANARLAARDHGVRLLGRMSHEAYARWLASGTLAVGQLTGTMGVSELEALATGVPLVMPLNRHWYDGAHETTAQVPVLGGPTDPTDLVRAALQGVLDALGGAAPAGGRAWVRSHHGPQRAVARLAERYAALA